MKKIPLRKSPLVGLSTLILVLPLSACGSSSDEAGATSCDGAQVSVGITNSLSDSIMVIADKKGYFKDQGLTVDFTEFDSGAKMIPQLGSGQLDVGAGAPSAGLYNAVARGIDFKIVADKGQLVTNYNYFPILVRKDLVDSGKVKSVADLKGLKVAESAQGSSAAATISAVLESDGLSYDDVEHEYIGFPDQVAAFQNGSIDAAATTEPTVTKLVESGAAVRFADSTKTYNNQQIAAVLYSGDFAENQSAAAQCFMNAYVKAAADYRKAVEGGHWTGSGADALLKIISAKLGLPADEIKKTVPGYVDPKAQVNEESIKKDYAFFKAKGWLEGGDVDASKLIDNSFVQKAASGSGTGAK